MGVCRRRVCVRWRGVGVVLRWGRHLLFVPLVVWFSYIPGVFTPYPNTTTLHYTHTLLRTHTLTLPTRLNTHAIPDVMLCYVMLNALGYNKAFL